MNLPNKLTLLRIFLVIPLIVVLSIFIWYVYEIEKNSFLDVSTKNNSQYFLYSIGAIFIISMITDAIDGHIARKRNQITLFGKLFDPLADKIIITTTLIFLAVFQYVHVSIVVLFVIRDLIVDGSRNVAAANNIKVEASIWGKLKTIFQSIAIPILLFLIPIIDQNKWWQLLLLNIPMILALITSLISGFLYFKQIIPIINKSK